jgi:hypothetical protein
MTKVFLDTETCGLHGLPILLQYAEEQAEIQLYEFWKHPVDETLELIEWLCTKEIVGFNLVFDWWHLAKVYTIWKLLPSDWIPEQHIDEIAHKEQQGCDGPCIKPIAACDLFLHSRRGPYQSLMAREDIRIKKIPNALAPALAQELEKRIELDGIYFAKRADKAAPKWKVMDIVSKSGKVNLDFKDVVLKFNPAGGLKFLAEYALKKKPKHYFGDVELDASWRPYELGYAPYCTAVAQAPSWECYDDGGKIIGVAWPALIQEHIRHWHESKIAREYAHDDVVYTRELYEYFGSPEPGDDDSELACMVAVVRWHGFKINADGINELLQKAVAKVVQAPINVNQHRVVRQYLLDTMNDIEASIIEDSTQRRNLEEIAKWLINEEEECTKCGGDGLYLGETCVRCGGNGKLQIGVHPAAVRARAILDVKIAGKEIELYTKLLKAGRLHASFKVIGTLSSRMSGGDGLNAQGIKHAENVRKMFPLTWDNYVLCGGDFDSFEVTLADAVFNDPDLRQTLKEKKKIHALLGVELFPGKTYDEIVASDGQEIDYYDPSKKGMFGFLYGGDFTTWNKKLGIALDVAKKAFDKWCSKFPGIGAARMRIHDSFCSMRQPGGIGSQVVWHEPDEYVETFLGFRRYFTLENKICKALFTLANTPPPAWRKCPIKVIRRDRLQTASGALSSALYGCAFQIQAANMRAANNHLIQSPGAQITKRLQRRIWDSQPSGVSDWFVAPMNIHDEIICVTNPKVVEEVAQAVVQTVESFRLQVPLIGMKWNLEMENWAEKKHGSKQIHITWEELNAK